MVSNLFIFSFSETLETISANTTFEDIDVWFGEQMQSVHWPELFKEIAPFIPYTDRNILLEVSGTNGVSQSVLWEPLPKGASIQSNRRLRRR